MRTSVIEVGDEIENNMGDTYTVRDVINGRCGILVIMDNGGGSYLPPELAPQPIELDWYGWGARSFIVLPSGQRIGTLEFYRADERSRVIEEYDAEWERTIEAMRSEEMQSRPTDIRMDS